MRGKGEPRRAFLVDAGRVLWPSGFGGGVSRFVELDPSNANSMRDVAGGVPWPISLAADASRIYWSEYKSGSIKSCPRSGCATAHETLADLFGYSTLLTTHRNNVFWFSAPEQWYRSLQPMDAELLECSSNGCGASPRRALPPQTTPCALAVDDTHIYWRTASNRFAYNWDYGDGAILRMKR